MQSISSSTALNLLALQDCRDGTRQVLPPLFVLRGRLPAFGGQRVILAFPAVFGRTPFGLDLALFLKLMQRGIKRAFFEREGVAAAARGFLKNFISVHFASRQQIEQQ